MSATAIREKRQTTIPSEVCEALGWGVNDRVDWRVEDGQAVVRKLVPQELEIVMISKAPAGGILPKGMKTTGKAAAEAVREERDEE